MKQKRGTRRLFSTLCALALIVGMVPAPAQAAGPASGGAVSVRDNALMATPNGNYDVISVEGYRIINQDGTEEDNRKLKVSTFSPDFRLLKTVELSIELPEIGGIFSGENYNFVVFGQDNWEEDESAEVLRIVKYTKDWKRLGAASLRDAFTTDVVGQHGNLSFAEYNGMLYIRLGRSTFTCWDGNSHQTNMTFCVRESDMVVTDQQDEISNIETGYVSHSLNQDILVDAEGRIVALDSGDAHPRGALLYRYDKKAGEDTFYTGKGEYTLLAAWPGTGNIAVGAETDALAETSQGYISAYRDSGKGQNYNWLEDSVNCYLVFTPKDDFTKGGSTYHELTHFSPGSSERGGMIDLIPTGPDGGWVLWSVIRRGSENFASADSTTTLHYARYYADGSLGTEHTAAGIGGRSRGPIYANGKVVWADNKDDVTQITFYTLDETGVSVHPVSETASEPASTPTPAPSETDPDPAQTSAPTPAGTGAKAARRTTITPEMFLLADGTLLWRDTSGQLLEAGTGFISVGGYFGNYLALREDGTLWGWGVGKGAELPLEGMTFLMDDVKEISGLLALKQDGTVWCAQRTAYVDPEGGMDEYGYYITDNAVQVSYGDTAEGLVLKNDGVVYRTDIYAPADNGKFVMEPVLDDVVKVSGRMAIRSDGSLWTWGEDSYGIRGDGEGTNDEPTKILDNVVDIYGEAMSHMSCGAFALTEDGSLYSWGMNNGGGLGYEGGNRTVQMNPFIFGENAYLTYQDVPKKVDIDNVAALASENGTTFVLKKDGTLWSIGGNGDGRALVSEDIQSVHKFTQVLTGVMLPDAGGGAATGFSDVSADAWYAPYVQAAAGAGLMQGTGNGRFGPDQTLSLAEVVTLTARLHAQENGGSFPSDTTPWYQGAYDYCVSQNLFTAAEFPLSSLSRTATRFEMVDLMDRAVPDADKAAIHTLAPGAVPDVAQSDPYGAVVYRWYAAGITQGDQAGRFNGESDITRSEVAAILCRLAGLTDRV